MTGRGAFDKAKKSLSLAHERKTSLCDPFLAILPVVGASVSILAGPASQSTVCASNSTAARLDEIQFDLGEGPCWDALSTRRPVLTDDVAHHASGVWPMFAEAVRTDARTSSVKGLYTFPLTVGSLDIGAVDLYATSKGSLRSDEVSDASALADVAAWQVLRKILADHELEDGPAVTGYSRREVHQATGMILAQLDISASDAELLLRAHAFATGRPVREVANDVVERRLDFSADRQK